MKKFFTRKLLKIFFIVCTLIFIPIASCLYFIACTTSGLRFSIDEANKLFSDYVEIKGTVADGTLCTGFKIDKYFEVNVKDIVIVRADKLDIDYSVWSYFFSDIFQVNKLETTKLEVQLTYQSDDSTDTETVEEEIDDSDPFRLDFLVKIKVKEAIVKDFAYLSDVVDVFVPNAKLELEAHDSYAAVVGGEAFDPTVHLKYEGDGIPSAKLPEILTYDNGKGAIEKITDIELPLDAAIYNLKINHGHYYEDSYDSGYFNAQVNALWTHTLLQVFSVKAQHQLGSLEVKGTMDFIDYYNLDFNVVASGNKTPYNLEHYDSSLYGLSGNFNLKGSLVDLNLDANVETPRKAKIIARMNTLSDEVPCYLSIQSPHLEYPLNIKEKAKHTSKSIFYTEQLQEVLSGLDAIEKNISATIDDSDLEKPQLSFKETALTLEGAIFKTMKVDFKTVFSGHGFSDTTIALDSDLSLDSAHINTFELQGQLGKRKVSGKVLGDFDFVKNHAFDGSFKFKADDAKDLASCLEGPLKIESDLKIALAPSDEESIDDMIVSIDKFTSSLTLNNHAAKLEVNGFSGNIDSGFDVDLLEFTQGVNKINLKGSLGNDSLLNGGFSLENISLIFPQVSGSLAGRLKIDGDIKSPQVTIAGRSAILRKEDFMVSNLIFDGTVNTSDKSVNLSVIANRVRPADHIKPYRKCSIDVTGDLSLHRLTLSCGSGTGSYISAQGGYTESTGEYKSTVSNLMLVSNVVDPISLKDPVNIEYNFNTQKGYVSPISISDGNMHVDIDEIILKPNSIATAVDVNKLNLESIQKYLPEKVKASGFVNFHSDILYANGLPTINAQVKATNGSIVAYSAFLPYENLNLKVDLNRSNCVSDLNIKLKRNQGTLDIQTDISDIFNSRKLSGRIDLTDLNLDLFTAVSKNLNTLDGKANIHANLDGTLSKPLLLGNIDVVGGADPKYSIGTFNKFNFKVKALGEHGVVDGLVTLNNSDVQIKGNLDWAEGAKGDLRVDAENLPIFLLTYGEALVNVHTQASIDDIIKITGRVDVPSGKIQFNSLDDDIVAPSKDEIFVDSKTNLDGIILDKKKATSINNDMEINVEVALGDDVKVRAMGLRANIVGGVIITKKSDSSSVQANGVLSLADASADLYGHKFVVNKGEAKFTNTLLSPNLSVEVVADPSTLEDEVLVGAKVRGTPTNPEITLFSKPAMSRNEILSYLLYGHGLEKNSMTTNSDTTSVQLLMSLGLGTTTEFLNSIVGIFGMDRVQLASSGTGNETQVEIQTYITNRLRLSYGYGIYNSVNEFKLRYEIVRKLYAEFISSIDHSVDLIYSFETN